MRTTPPLDGRSALVTGASGGIGAALAVALARAGADLVLTYSGHRDAAESAADDVRRVGRTATVVHADLTVPTAGRDLVAGVGPVDVLVANAGLGLKVSWDEVDDALWASTFGHLDE